MISKWRLRQDRTVATGRPPGADPSVQHVWGRRRPSPGFGPSPRLPHDLFNGTRVELARSKPGQTILYLGNPRRLDLLDFVVETLKQQFGEASSIPNGQSQRSGLEFSNRRDHELPPFSSRGTESDLRATPALRPADPHRLRGHRPADETDARVKHQVIRMAR